MVAYCYNQYVTLEEDYPYLSGEEYQMKCRYLNFNSKNSTVFPIDADVEELGNELVIAETTEKYSCRYSVGEIGKIPVKLSKSVNFIETTKMTKEEKKNRNNERSYE